MSAVRVAVTGLGWVTPLGHTLETVWEALRAGRSAIGPCSRFDTSRCRARMAAEIHDFEPRHHLAPHRLKRLDRYCQFAVVSAALALKDAGLEAPSRQGRLDDRMGVIGGTALAGISVAESRHATFVGTPGEPLPPAFAMQVFAGSAHSQIAIELGCTGYATTNGNSCVAGAVAVGEAWRAIRDGLCDVVLAFGAEAPLNPLTFAAFDRIECMDPVTAYAFDRRRAGFVMAEGGACLVCERWDRAVARGARIYAEIAGYWLNNDAFHMTSPRPDLSTITACMRGALATAGAMPEDVDLINAHASGTQLNDSTETAAIKQVLGERAASVPVTAFKPYLGHGLGVASAWETAIVCLMLQHNWAPPTLRLEEPDLACDLDYVPLVGRTMRPHCVLKNAFGFGGINACLVLRRPKLG